MAELTAMQQLWVAALRSGEYKQGRNRLKTIRSDGTLHCCLGVAVELCPDTEWEASDPGGLSVRTEGGTHPGLPPKEVFDWLDTEFDEWGEDGDRGVGSIRLDIPDGWVATDSVPVDLYTHNDIGMTFDQIADLIEYFGLVPIQTLNEEA